MTTDRTSSISVCPSTLGMTRGRDGKFQAEKILDYHPDYILVLDLDYRISWANEAVCTAIGTTDTEIIGRCCHHVMQRMAEPCPSCPVNKAIETGEPRQVEISGPDGRLWDIWARPVYHEEDISHVMVVTKDITVRKQTEKALRESELELAGILHAVTDHMSKIDEDHNILWANHTARQLFGPDLVGRKCYEAYHDIDRPCRPCIVSQCFEDGNIHEHETEVLAADGSRKVFRCVASVGARYDDGRPRTVVEISRDITGWRTRQTMLAAYHRKLRTLTSELSLAEEKERRRIAAEVHDHIGQKLAFVKMKLAELEKLLPEPPDSKLVRDIKDLVGSTIQDTRSLVSELGLPILYELGFVPAVQWLAEQYRHNHDLKVKVIDDRRPKPMTDDIKAFLFQAVRELLTNVKKHARATGCTVSLTVNGDDLQIRVEDDGEGFSPEEIEKPAGMTSGFGLFSIRERLEPFGAHLDVESQRGKGTTAKLVLPLIGRKNVQQT